jgi:hypothetical protein
MAIFAATFTGIGVTAAQDLFELVAGARRVLVREVVLGQYSEFGTGTAELLPISLIRGNTTAGSGGTAITPGNVSGHAAAAAAVSAVTRNNTTVASGGSPADLRAEAWNIQIPWIWRPILDECFILEAGQLFAVRLNSAPADSITMTGTLLFEEDF